MIAPLTTAIAVTLALTMRQRDTAEILSTEWGDDVCAWAARQVQNRGEKWAIVDGQGIPVAMGGAVPMWPGVAQTWLAGTDRMPSFAPQLLRACRDLHLRLADAGVHRFQTYVQPKYETGVRFLERLGYSYESTARKITKTGEDLDLMTMTGDVP